MKSSFMEQRRCQKLSQSPSFHLRREVRKEKPMNKTNKQQKDKVSQSENIELVFKDIELAASVAGVARRC